MTGEGKIHDAAPFLIGSLQDAANFARYISRYGDSINSGYDIYDHIVNSYNYSRIHSEDERINGKLLHAYVDLELTYLFMMKDVDLAAGTNNQLHNRGKIASVSALEDFELFSGKVNILYAYRLCRSEFVHFGTNTWEYCFCYTNAKSMRIISRTEAESLTLSRTLKNGPKFQCISENV